MSRLQIYSLYVLIDLMIVAGVVWCVFHRIPVGKYLIPAIVLFMLSGLWLIVMTLKSTNPRS
jgi:hypothetical protein